MDKQTIENINNISTDIKDDAGNYVGMLSDLVQLKAIEKTTVALTDLIFFVVLSVLSVAGLLMMSVAVGLVVQEVWGNWIVSASAGCCLFALNAVLLGMYGKERMRDHITQILVESIYHEQK